jgi:cbb3-type cytochrome oxidase subunit 3
MFQDFFRGNEWLELPLIALVFFFVFFLAVLWRVAFRMRDRRRVEQLAALPFDDGEAQGPRKEHHHG